MQKVLDTKEDIYRIWVPIEEQNSLLKSVETDENGDYIVQGVMTSEDLDEEEDSITPEGVDCSYFLEKGWIKYEHGQNPAQFIGEPIEVKVGRFNHPTLCKSVNGVFVKGRLFAQRELAKQAVQTITDLQKAHTKRRMGWSIEGSVVKRDEKTGKIAKSIIRNVVLTMNPINTSTFAELAKSFAKGHEIIINTDDIAKSMDTDSIKAVTNQSIEGYKPTEIEENDQEKWIKLFRDFVKTHVIQKSFTDNTRAYISMEAYSYALANSLTNDLAYEFASYIADRYDVIKSISKEFIGGGTMSKKKISDLLDSSIEELEKSIQSDLQKSKSKGKDGTKEHEEAETEEEEKDEHDKGEEDPDENEDDETEKALNNDLMKSFTEENAQAIEVSDFLGGLVDTIGGQISSFNTTIKKSIMQQNSLAKVVLTVGELVKSLNATVQALQEENTELKKSMEDILNKPVGRRGIVSQKETSTLSKGLDTNGRPLNRSQIEDILLKSFEAGELDGSAVIRFNSGVNINNLNLPDSVRLKLGI